MQVQLHSTPNRRSFSLACDYLSTTYLAPSLPSYQTSLPKSAQVIGSTLLQSYRETKEGSFVLGYRDFWGIHLLFYELDMVKEL